MSTDVAPSTVSPLELALAEVASPEMWSEVVSSVVVEVVSSVVEVVSSSVVVPSEVAPL